jgi:Zn finger protein HypA/HybF involved in hydrogenase expression
MKLSPFKEVVKNAEERMNQGWDIYQQFNCAHCGIKQTISDKNKFYTMGLCEECNGKTNIVKDGCNFMATKEV